METFKKYLDLERFNKAIDDKTAFTYNITHCGCLNETDILITHPQKKTRDLYHGRINEKTGENSFAFIKTVSEAEALEIERQHKNQKPKKIHLFGQPIQSRNGR